MQPPQRPEAGADEVIRLPEASIGAREMTVMYSGILDGRRMLPAIARAARDTVGAAYGAISLTAPNGTIEYFVPSGLGGIDGVDGAIGALRDIMAAAGMVREKPKATVLRAPIIGSERTLGYAYAAGTLNRREFTDDDIRSLAAVAAYAAIAIEAPRAAQSSKLTSTMLAALSHEVRTPLTVVLGLARTLELHSDELDQATKLELVQRIATSAQRLDALISQFLELGALQRGVNEAVFRPADLSGLVRMVVSESDLVGRGPIHSRTERVIVAVDAVKVERIVENLLSNVARHTPVGTPVWISVLDRGREVLLSVEDAGPGVPTEDREAIFEPLRVGSGASKHAPGAGMGLALVARYAEMHGGYAWVDERDGGGASFRVMLPKRV